MRIICISDTHHRYFWPDGSLRLKVPEARCVRGLKIQLGGIVRLCDIHRLIEAKIAKRYIERPEKISGKQMMSRLSREYDISEQSVYKYVRQYRAGSYKKIK